MITAKVSGTAVNHMQKFFELKKILTRIYHVGVTNATFSSNL